MSLEKDEEVVIFEAYLAGSANIFKNLIELLSQVAPIKKVTTQTKVSNKLSLKLQEWYIYYIDHQSDILINISLDADKFGSYKLTFLFQNCILE